MQSRYYDPNIGRFINADEAGVLALTKGEAVGHNLFAYCGNDPVNKVDPTGYMAELVAGAYFIPGIGEILLTATIIAAIIGLVAWLIWKIYHISADAISKAKTMSSADTKIRNTVKSDSRTRYWSATLKAGYVDIGRPLTYSQAVPEVAAGRNVFTVTKYEAYTVARVASKNKTPVHHFAHEKSIGYYNHYHLYNHTLDGHVWYLY